MKKNNLFVALVSVFGFMVALAACKHFETSPSASPQSESSQSASQESNESRVTAQTNQSRAAEPADKGTGNEKRASAETSQASDPSARRGALLFSSSLVGSRVKDAKGNDVGKIKDLLFDPENRRVVYAILTLSNRDIAVPLSAVKMDPQTQNYTLDMTEEGLAEAPRIGKDKKLSSELGESPRQEELASSAAGKEPSKANP